MRASMLAYLGRYAGSVQQLKSTDCMRHLLHTSAAYHSVSLPSRHSNTVQ